MKILSECGGRDIPRGRYFTLLCHPTPCHPIPFRCCCCQVSKGWQPNHTPPGGELVFEAYMVEGELNVAAFFDIATPSQVSFSAVHQQEIPGTYPSFRSFSPITLVFSIPSPFTLVACTAVDNQVRCRGVCFLSFSFRVSPRRSSEP